MKERFNELSRNIIENTEYQIKKKDFEYNTKIKN